MVKVLSREKFNMPNKSLKTFYDLISPEYTLQDIEHFKTRWNSELQPVREGIVLAIENQDEPSLHAAFKDLKDVVYLYHNNEVKLLDLRGIDLSNLSFGDMDFSYCCFDFSDLNYCFFDGTHFQYSSFKCSNLKNSTWIHTQAAPVSLIQSDLTDAVIKSSFLMHADFYKAITDNLLLPQTDIVQAQLNMYDSQARKLKL
jgi:uncharacterized protein YjbI with pentapeptide repeats